MNNTEKKELLKKSINNDTLKNTKSNDEIKVWDCKELGSFHELLLRGLEIHIKNRNGGRKWKTRVLYLGNNGNGCPKFIIERYKKIVNDGTEKGIELQDIECIYNGLDSKNNAIVYIIPHKTVENINANVREYHIRFPTYKSSEIMVKKSLMLLKKMGYDVKTKLEADVL